MKKVLIPTKLDKVASDILEKSGLFSVVQDHATPLETLAAQHPDAYALIVRSEKVSKDVIDKFPELHVIVRAGAGVNTIDIKYARKKKIDVMNTPGANSNGVAEEVLALMLADARHIIKADASARKGDWEKSAFMGRELAGKTIGILGLGAIGRLVAKRLGGFDMKFLGYDPMVSAERAAEWGVELTDLKTIFSKSDYITLHIPEIEETKKMVNESLLSLMKKGASLINCARAGVLDEEALRKLKAEKGIRFLNDVYAKDEAGPKSVADIADIMVPHLGASTFEANFMAAKRSAEELIELETKGVTSYVVNRDIPEGLSEEYCVLANTLAKLSRRFIGRDSTPVLLETSFYGELEKYSDWMLLPIMAGMWEGFDSSMDSKAARAYLDEVGVEYVNRKIDQSKGYGNSITLDLVGQVSTGTLKRISIRGTVAERTMVVSRINDFNKLYFEPVGHTLVFQYDDRPGVVGTIGVKLAEAGINILDVRHAHDVKSNSSLVIIGANSMPDDAVIEAIGKEIKAYVVFGVTL